MSNFRKVTLFIALILFSAIVFLSWYRFHFSMDVAEPYEVIVEDPRHQLLIATQGSEFKKAVVTGVVDAFKDEPVSITVIDVTGLSSIDLDDWSAVVILHTWETWKPQVDAEKFLENKLDLSKLVILTTSGDGGFKMDGVDAITSASTKTDIPARTSEIVERINNVFDKELRK